MLKGFNRRVVVMKNTGSDLFDEAYFIVKENVPFKRKGGVSAVEEAKNIVLGISGEKKKNLSPLTIFKDRRFIFFSGVVTGLFLGKIFLL